MPIMTDEAIASGRPHKIVITSTATDKNRDHLQITFAASPEMSLILMGKLSNNYSMSPTSETPIYGVYIQDMDGDEIFIPMNTILSVRITDFQAHEICPKCFGRNIHIRCADGKLHVDSCMDCGWRREENQ